MQNQRERVLRRLRENRGGFVSGAALGESLQVSRAAVWKQIQALRRRGYRIEARPNAGYRLLEEPDRLALEPGGAGGIHYFAAVDSTNHTARELAEQGQPGGSMVIAEEQRRGRGRRGRSWASPPGAGLWFSVVLRPAGMTPADAAPITLATAATLARCLQEETGLAVRVKWPNDLLIGGRKAGGILTELKGEPDRVEYLIIGIGLNINHEPADFPPELRGRATSCYLESGRKTDRTALFLSLRENLDAAFGRFMQSGFLPFRPLWLAVNATLGTRVRISRPGAPELEGLALDLDQGGALVVEDCDGRRHHIRYGEIS
jgi:BirA family transcriptional regulator, biotin operon repressor / biotin---[acetyl-CoA-carboxylase] ligase